MISVGSATGSCDEERRAADRLQLRWLTLEEPMANPPSLTPEQRQRALEKAGAARRQRAEVKDKLKIGSLSLGELFEATDRGDESGNMLAKLKVVSVLESLPGVGKVNAKRLLKGLDISDGRRLGGVGDKQRERLLRVVDDLEYRREILAEARRSEESTAR
jgi:hypothetical protein